MEFREMIEKAEKTAGGQKQLGLFIGINPSNIRTAKAGIKGLPSYACVLIADMIGENRTSVIAASELVTEKKKERREVWHSVMKHAASLFFFGVILNMSPTPANASQCLQVIDNTVYYVKYIRYIVICRLARR